MFSLATLNKKWLSVTIILVALNIAGIVCSIIMLSKSWIELLIIAVVVIGDIIAYHFISKNLTTPPAA